MERSSGSASAEESKFRDYAYFTEWMGPLMTGSHKVPKVEDADVEEEAPVEDAEEKDTYKYLQAADYTRNMFMIAVAQHNVSYALALEVANMRDDAVAKGNNIVTRSTLAAVTFVALPVLSVAIVIEAVVRQVVGMIGSCFFAAIPPAPNGKTKKEVEKEQADGKEYKREEPKKSLLAKHAEFVDNNQDFIRRQNNALVVAFEAVSNVVGILFANFNIFHTTDFVRSRMPLFPLYQAMPILVQMKASGLASIATDFFAMFGHPDYDARDYVDNGHQVKFRAQREDHRMIYARSDVNPLFASFVEIGRLEEECGSLRSIIAAVEEHKTLSAMPKARHEAEKRVKDEESIYHGGLVGRVAHEIARTEYALSERRDEDRRAFKKHINIDIIAGRKEERGPHTPQFEYRSQYSHDALMTPAGHTYRPRRGPDTFPLEESRLGPHSRLPFGEGRGPYHHLSTTIVPDGSSVFGEEY